jgi:alpha-glucosidase (family GH31 glycosyl hydrolase)
MLSRALLTGLAGLALGAVPATAAPLSALREPSGNVRLTQPGGPTLRTVSVRFRVDGRWRADTGRLSVRPERPGQASLSASLRGADAVSISFAAPARERYFGFGERSNAVAQRGTVVENYVSDGPFSPDSRAVARAVVPPAGFRARDDATYYPVPWLLSGRGYGVLIANDETSSFRLPGPRGGRWSATVSAPRLRLRVFAGPTPAAALRRFTAAVGRQPPPPAPWAFGPWLQTGQPNAPPLADQIADLEKLRAADAPVSAAETQLRYLPCGLDRGLEAYEAQRVAYYHSMGLAVLTYVNPMLCASYEPRFSQARATGALLRGPDGGPSLFNSFVGGTGSAGFTIQQVGEYDFTSAAGVSAYRQVIDRMLAVPHEGWMEDFGEYTPLDARAANGLAGSALHNRYPVLYHCAVHRITAGRPVVRFQRSGWTGAARCADDVWGGDPTTSFGFDGLSSAVKQALSMGLSGVSRWGSDIGGYDTIGSDPRLTPELLKRWIAFGAVSGVMRIKKSGLEIPAYRRPQVWART